MNETPGATHPRTLGPADIAALQGKTLSMKTDGSIRGHCTDPKSKAP